MYCNTYHCELSEAACAKRYRMASGGAGWGITSVRTHLAGDLGCSDCATGRQAAQNQTALKPAGHTVKNNSNKNISARRKIKMTEKQADYHTPGSTAVCKKCGAEKDLDQGFYKARYNKSGHDSTCKQCRNAAATARQKRYRRQQPTAAEKQIPPVAEPDFQEIPPPESPGELHVLELDFSSCPDLLGRIEAIAERELRTPANQVLYWLVDRVRSAAGAAPKGVNHER